jgi:K+-transporting ATPase KdpF subunit
MSNMGVLGSWDYILWGLVALALLVYLAYVLIRAERF